MASVADNLKDYLQNTPVRELIVTSRTEADGASVSRLGVNEIMKAFDQAQQIDNDGNEFGTLRLF